MRLLHKMNPTRWNVAVLAERMELDEKYVRTVIKPPVIGG